MAILTFQKAIVSEENFIFLKLAQCVKSGHIEYTLAGIFPSWAHKVCENDYLNSIPTVVVKGKC